MLSCWEAPPLNIILDSGLVLVFPVYMSLCFVKLKYFSLERLCLPSTLHHFALLVYHTTNICVICILYQQYLLPNHFVGPYCGYTTSLRFWGFFILVFSYLCTDKPRKKNHNYVDLSCVRNVAIPVQ